MYGRLYVQAQSRPGQLTDRILMLLMRWYFTGSNDRRWTVSHVWPVWGLLARCSCLKNIYSGSGDMCIDVTKSVNYYYTITQIDWKIKPLKFMKQKVQEVAFIRLSLTYEEIDNNLWQSLVGFQTKNSALRIRKCHMNRRLINRIS